MLRTCLLSLLLAALGGASLHAAELPRLRVAHDQRHLETEDGQPFFYLGDTAWELFHRLDREETAAYLNDRAKKGFNVIQAVVLAEYHGLTEPNRQGHLPLEDNDPTRPQEDYFRDVDWTIAEANERGMYVGLLPTWGDKWNKKWGIGPEVFTPENARVYGEFLGKRYRGAGIIWILGGDRNPDNDRHKEIIRAMAAGIREGDGGRHLITFHPQGGSGSSQFFHKDEWLDFNMFQSGHGAKVNENDRFITRDRSLTPVKPTLDGEPRYEDHPIAHKPDTGWFDETDARQAMYWSVLAGAAGHTYGDHNIWQFYSEERKPISAARTPWRKALEHPGSTQVGLARELFMNYGFGPYEPANELVVKGAGQGKEKVVAGRSPNGAFLLVYSSAGKPFSIDLGKLPGERVIVSWFDPRTGKSRGQDTLRRSGVQEFVPPSSGEADDWVLVVKVEK